MDKLYEQAIFYAAGLGAVAIGILAILGTGGFALATGIPESLILLGFTSILGGSLTK